MAAAAAPKAWGHPPSFISLMSGWRMFIYVTVRLSVHASGALLASVNYIGRRLRAFFASLEASAVVAGDDVFVKVYDL